MIRSPWIICIVMLLLVSLPALATQKTYEYHHDARMQLGGGAVENAYGYVYVVTDKQGHGVIRVMFSNGTRLQNARFNARLSFLDAGGGLLRKESFSQRIQAAGSDGAAEHAFSRLVKLNEFASLRVELFLSDIPARGDAPLRGDPAFLRTRFSGD